MHSIEETLQRITDSKQFQALGIEKFSDAQICPAEDFCRDGLRRGCSICTNSMRFSWVL